MKDVPKRENTIAETQKQIKQQQGLQHRKSIETRSPQYHQDRALKEGMLKNCDYTKSFSDKQIAIVAADCQIQEFKPADLIVREHDRALCMYILQAGEVGEYKNFPQPSALRTVDPWLMKDKRTQVFNTQNHVFCALSLFLGVPAASTYAAMKATIMLRVPVTAIQPVLANSRELVNYVAVMLLKNPSLANSNDQGDDGDRAKRRLQRRRLMLRQPLQLPGWDGLHAELYPGRKWVCRSARALWDRLQRRQHRYKERRLQRRWLMLRRTLRLPGGHGLHAELRPGRKRVRRSACALWLRL